MGMVQSAISSDNDLNFMIELGTIMVVEAEVEIIV
jgi:hypothetical protein